MALNLTGAFLILAVCDVVFNITDKKDNKKIKGQKGTLWLLVVMSSLYLITQLLSFVTIDLAPITSNTVAIRNLNVVVASVLAIFLLKEELTRYKMASYALSAAGIVLVAL